MNSGILAETRTAGTNSNPLRYDGLTHEFRYKLMSTKTGEQKMGKPVGLLGVDRDKIEVMGDIIEPLDIEWEAEQIEGCEPIDPKLPG